MDSLSLLPDHLISTILSLLPSKEAARTTVLSRRWRFLWAHIAGLHIDAHRLFPFDLTKQIPYIDTILSSSHLNILKLEINITPGAPAPVSARWAENLACRGLTEVSLDYLGQANQALQFLFTSKSLKKLRLKGGWLCTSTFSPPPPPPRLVACPSLKHIEFDSVTLSDAVIREILSACENLSTFDIRYFCSSPVVVKHQRLECFVVSGALTCDIHIEAPNLRELELDVSRQLGRIRVLAPRVKKSRIRFSRSWRATDSDLCGLLRELLAGIGSTEELQLGPEVVQCLSSCLTPMEFASNFQNLKKLDVISYYKDPEVTSALTALLQSYSQLPELT